jgi:hypothetical protein
VIVPEEEGGVWRTWNVFWVRKMVLADSEGVIVAVVMSVMILRVSSSSRWLGGADEMAEKESLRAGGTPLLSFYTKRVSFQGKRGCERGRRGVCVRILVL